MRTPSQERARRFDFDSVAVGSLSPRRRMLVWVGEVMPFGRVINLSVRNGEPVLDPLPRLVPTGDDAPRRRHARASDGTLIRSQFVDLFRYMSFRRDFVIGELTYQNGLPVHW